jgi:CRISPR/Cas system endoribonuclease Cas6 (RAMP superfamily)
MGQWNYIRYVIKEVNKTQKKLSKYINKAIKDKVYPEHIEYVKSRGKDWKDWKNLKIEEGIDENRRFNHSWEKRQIDDTINYNAELDKEIKDNKTKQRMLNRKKYLYDTEFSD